MFSVHNLEEAWYAIAGALCIGTGLSVAALTVYRLFGLLGLIAWLKRNRPEILK